MQNWNPTLKIPLLTPKNPEDVCFGSLKYIIYFYYNAIRLIRVRFIMIPAKMYNEETATGAEDMPVISGQ